MHNLHLVVTKASSLREACITVQNYIADWGDENNWRTICGCVSEDNETYIYDADGRYLVEGGITIDHINRMVNGWVEPEEHYKNAFQKVATSRSEQDWMTWFLAKEYCDKMSARAMLENPTAFDVLKHELFYGHYDKNGVTRIENSFLEEEDANDFMHKTYVVFVDMHS